MKLVVLGMVVIHPAGFWVLTGWLIANVIRIEMERRKC